MTKRKSPRESSSSCSFCNKGRAEVRRLIAGGGDCNICDECVGICVGIISENEGAEPEAADGVVAAAVEHVHDGTVTCGFCRTPSDEVLLISGRGPLCSTCLEAIGRAVSAKLGEP